MTENCPDRSDLVKSLASTIHKRIVSPVADKTSTITLEITDLNQRVSSLEKDLSLLAAAHSRTRLLAAAAALGAAALGVYLLSASLG